MVGLWSREYTDNGVLVADTTEVGDVRRDHITKFC